MYASHGFLRSDIGDVDVVHHDGLFHLFHLVLPNHDFIAHAVSRDGMTWRRVRNALFVGDPGAWDDDMLWTMHVSPDPDRAGCWRMFYTGLSRAEYGRVQRVGLARSDDLYTWTRCDAGNYPLEVAGPWYETSVDEGRHWVSFRDPFFWRDPATGDRLLLAAARVKSGPVIRRGCVGLAREIAPDHFEFGPPLHVPGLYDDVEVPNLLQLGELTYLIGSIREDTKIRYWQADGVAGPYRNFADNVLLPKGNYAARVCGLGDGRYLLFNFFARKEVVNGREITARLLPPPKELVADSAGRLILKSYGGFDAQVRNPFQVTNPAEFTALFGNASARIGDSDGAVHLSCPSGFEGFLLPGRHQDFRLRARLQLDGPGKCGLVLRVSDEGDGYYLALDFAAGYAQLRRWGANPHPEFERAFQYETLQSGNFVARNGDAWDVEVVAHGAYIEFSINGQVTLCVVDDTYPEGAVGFYAESADLRLGNVTMEWLRRLVSEEEAEYTATRSPDPHLAAGETGTEP